jgi:hypothetical protein
MSNVYNRGSTSSMQKPFSLQPWYFQAGRLAKLEAAKADPVKWADPFGGCRFLGEPNMVDSLVAKSAWIDRVNVGSMSFVKRFSCRNIAFGRLVLNLQGRHF